MFYKILSNNEVKRRISVSPNFFSDHVLVDMSSVMISLGHRNQNVEVVQRKDLNDDELIISEDVIESLCIPLGIRYQVNFIKNGIRLGPVIGLLMAVNQNGLTRNRIKGLLDYTLIYPEIQGLLVAFSAEGIDFEDKTVEGYCYNPGTGSKKMPWISGKFPLPDAIFMRVNPPEAVRLKLKRETNNCLFNSNYFDKWKFWNMASKFNKTEEHLPYTRLCSSMEDVDHVLSHFGEAYLKPLNGTLSRGLYKVLKAKDVYTFKDKRGNSIKDTSIREEAKHLVSRIIGRNMYLVQQALHSIKVENRHMDFRVIMQKDQTMKWICTGMVAFIGRPGDICTNWGYQTTFEELFHKRFNYSQEEIFKKKQEVIDVCKSICDVLDLTGENYGDLGFDVLIDESLKVWVLESNKRHYHSVPLWINDVQTFYAVKTNPVKYAAALGGFKVY